MSEREPAAELRSRLVEVALRSQERFGVAPAVTRGCAFTHRGCRWAEHMDPYTLAYLAGHSDFAMTKRYVHPQRETVRKAMAKVRGAYFWAYHKQNGLGRLTRGRSKP